jgi:hypothetical protein
MPRLLLLAILVSGCTATGSETAPPGDVGVQVSCSDALEMAECPSGDLRLEIGERAWGLADGPGSAHVETTSRQEVRVVDAASCVVLVVFEAEPGHDYYVQLAADGHATAVDLAREEIGFEWGPELATAPISSCR